jgi:hypothetical protein
MALRNLCLGIALAVGLLTAPAQAAIISGTYAFNASGFASGFPTVAGSFTLSFDNSADITNSTALTVNSLTVGGVPSAIFGTIAFSYDQSDDRLNIGGLAGGADGILAANDFSLRFQPVSGAGGPVFFGVRVGTGNGAEFPGTQSGTFTPADVRTPVPAPAALALFGLGLLGLGVVRRRAVG